MPQNVKIRGDEDAVDEGKSMQ
jgi:hypothetical protein